MTELTSTQQDMITEFYQTIKETIKENEVVSDPISFQPIKRIVLELPLEVISNTSFHISKEKLYETIGKVICGVEDT